MKRMKQIRHFALALAAILLLSNANYVQASELVAADTDAIQVNEDVMPLSAYRTFNFGRSRQTFTVGIQAVYHSSTLTLHMPRNNGLSLVQGTIYFIPNSGGSQITKSYSNYSKEDLTIDLSTLPEAVYMIKIEGAAVGTNTNVYVDFNFTT